MNPQHLIFVYAADVPSRMTRIYRMIPPVVSGCIFAYCAAVIILEIITVRTS